uniref:Uncharacterized protein n=1 Tax=Anguilla anguilla TaxID=7936 RepID=A0A0E9QIS5_ANGAN
MGWTSIVSGTANLKNATLGDKTMMSKLYSYFCLIPEEVSSSIAHMNWFTVMCPA